MEQQQLQQAPVPGSPPKSQRTVPYCPSSPHHNDDVNMDDNSHSLHLQQQQPNQLQLAESHSHDSPEEEEVDDGCYRDFLRVSVSEVKRIIHIQPPKRRGPRGGVVEPFPEKLYDVLLQLEKEPETEEIVSWQSHGRCFFIHQPAAFVVDILPRFFRQTKLTSFQRQVNLYGFTRLTSGRDRGGYYHELFLNGRPDLLPHMHRTRGPDAACARTSRHQQLQHTKPEPNLWLYPPAVARKEDTRSERIAVVPTAAFSFYPEQQQQSENNGFNEIDQSRQAAENECRPPPPDFRDQQYPFASSYPPSAWSSYPGAAVAGRNRPRSNLTSSLEKMQEELDQRIQRQRVHQHDHHQQHQRHDISSNYRGSALLQSPSPTLPTFHDQQKQQQEQYDKITDCYPKQPPLIPSLTSAAAAPSHTASSRGYRRINNAINDEGGSQCDGDDADYSYNYDDDDDHDFGIDQEWDENDKVMSTPEPRNRQIAVVLSAGNRRSAPTHEIMANSNSSRIGNCSKRHPSRFSRAQHDSEDKGNTGCMQQQEDGRSRSNNANETTSQLIQRIMSGSSCSSATKRALGTSNNNSINNLSAASASAVKSASTGDTGSAQHNAATEAADSHTDCCQITGGLNSPDELSTWNNNTTHNSCTSSPFERYGSAMSSSSTDDSTGLFAGHGFKAIESNDLRVYEELMNLDFAQSHQNIQRSSSTRR